MWWLDCLMGSHSDISHFFGSYLVSGGPLSLVPVSPWGYHIFPLSFHLPCCKSRGVEQTAWGLETYSWGAPCSLLLFVL